MTKHTEFDADGRCKDCGQKYHCVKCGQPCGGYGHLVDYEGGSFYKCQDPARYELLLAKRRLERSQNDIEQLHRLIKQYPNQAQLFLEGL